MARKKKIAPTKVVNEIPKVRTLKGMKKLKEGDIVLYKTRTIIDRAVVDSIDKSNGTAKLNNNVTVSRGISSDGKIMKIGTTDITCEIRLWDESCEQEFEWFMAKRDIKSIATSLLQLCDNGKMDNQPVKWSSFCKKLTKYYNIATK